MENLSNTQKLSRKFNNNVRRLEAETFIQAPNLKEIIFNSNLLEFVHEDAFKKLTKLQQLGLDGNFIESLSINIFDDLESLKIVYLAENRIEDLPGGLFRNNLKLEQIILQKNKIKTISSNLFTNLKSLTNVDLRYNLCIHLDFGIEGEMIPFSKMYDEINKCKNANTLENMNKFCKAT